MSIQVDVARICGFRGISNVEVTLPRITVLLGQNNAGKTSVIEALQLALGDYSRYLSNAFVAVTRAKRTFSFRWTSAHFHIGRGPALYTTPLLSILGA